MKPNPIANIESIDNIENDAKRNRTWPSWVTKKRNLSGKLSKTNNDKNSCRNVPHATLSDNDGDDNELKTGAKE